MLSKNISTYDASTSGLPWNRRVGSMALLTPILLAIVVLAAAVPAIASQSYLGSSNWIILDPHSCNATSLTQVPGFPNLMINRQFHGKDNVLPGVQGSKCGTGGVGEHLGLTLDEMDWKTHSLRIVKVLLDTSVDSSTHHSKAVVTAGPMRGLVISSAYDASIVRFNNKYLVAYECISENGGQFGIAGTSSCISVYDPVSQTLDLDRTQVVVSGVTEENRFYAAAVPELLVFKHRLYIYWSSLMIVNGKFSAIAMRGTELTMAPDGTVAVSSNHAPYVKGNDPLNTTEVWAPDPNDPLSSVTTDARSIWAHGDKIIAMASRGGSGCTAPSDNTKGCFRLAIVKAKQPLGEHVFNNAEKVSDESLPSNPQEYTTPVVDPDGQYWFIGHYLKPTNNGYSERRPLPGAEYWTQTKENAVLVLFPITDKSLWPK